MGQELLFKVMVAGGAASTVVMVAALVFWK
jgi:hypothetical protein